ncbi:hypothetical protein RU97_GL001418 [Enterococcus canis]|jgi:Protein of unknown function (DUF3230).|uniref:GTP cyclohydrolase n=1 Tax=Enterococcus canis TaxID=214095 RepID=A0A1L8RGA8_9ENTE|nr:DUF960 domain-containing protein [Enterococcus canis]OJG18800.1 hypothetical protein RU97_GL001418 [Enterococcus canis]
MHDSFDSRRSRYASVGVVSSLPGEIIDSIWIIIDMDLKGLVPLDNILTFRLLDKEGQLTIHFSQEGTEVEMDVDLPFPFSDNYPAEVYAYDDGSRETILLPSEIKQR